MHPILFHIPILGWPVYSYGAMLVIGLMGALQLAKFLARRYGLNPELFMNAGLIALATGIIGARGMHVIENWSEYALPARSFFENFWAMINIRQGGLTFYGGLIFAFPCCMAYAVYQKVPLRLGMDIVAPCVLIGLGVGRIGCFLNGCCEGAACDVPWAVTYPYHSNPYLREVSLGQIQVPSDLMTRSGPQFLESQQDMANRPFTPEEIAMYTKHSGDTSLDTASRSARSVPIHPAQLYSTFTALLLAGICVAYFTLPHAPGQVMGLMLAMEGLSRFLLETLRVEPAVRTIAGVDFSVSMLVGLLICGVGIILWTAFGLFSRRTPFPNPSPA